MIIKLLKLVLIIWYAVSTLTVRAQDSHLFYAQINTVYQHQKTDNLTSSILVYEKAFKSLDYIHVIYLKDVLDLAKRNNDKDRIHLYKSRIKFQNKGSSDILIRQIDSLIKKDQSVRIRKYERAIKYYKNCISNENWDHSSKRFLKSKLLSSERTYVDSCNMDFLFNLFDANGFIGESLIGSKFQAVDVLLFHYAKNPNSKKMLPFLTSALAKGKITPLRYAQITDLYSQFNTGSQNYWLWPNYYKCTSPLSKHDIKMTLQSRKRIGIYHSNLIQVVKGDYWILQNQFNL